MNQTPPRRLLPLAALLTLWLPLSPLNAQPRAAQPRGEAAPDDGVRWRYGGGFGSSILSGISVGAFGAYNPGLHLLTLAVRHERQLQNLFPNADSTTSGGNTLTEIAAMYGIIFRGEGAAISLSTGASFITGTTYTLLPSGFTSEKYSTFGLPVQLYGGLDIEPWIGVGATLFANFNSPQPTRGVLLTLCLGRLR